MARGGRESWSRDSRPDVFEVPNQCCHLLTWSQPENKNTVSFSGNWELISPLGSLDPLKVLLSGYGFVLPVSSIGPVLPLGAGWHGLPPPYIQPVQSAHHRERIIITMVYMGPVAGAHAVCQPSMHNTIPSSEHTGHMAECSGGSEVQGYPWLQSEFKARVGCIRHCLKTNKQKNPRTTTTTTRKPIQTKTKNQEIPRTSLTVAIPSCQLQWLPSLCIWENGGTENRS